MLRQAYKEGLWAGLVKHGLAKQPSIKSTGVKNPSDTKDLPDLPKAPNIPLRSRTDSPAGPPVPVPLSLGGSADKLGFNVGMGSAPATAGSAGACRGEPADVGRRQRSLIDRTFQENEDSFATSSMPLPGSSVAP